MNKICLLIVLTALFTSCYRMPTDEDFCVIPTTNNPGITREKLASPMPGVQY